MKRLAILRTANVPYNKHYYNLQEVGLAKAIAPYGIEVDVYYASKSNESNNVIYPDPNKNEIRLISMPIRWELKFTRSQCLLKSIKAQLQRNNYDAIQIQDTLSLGSVQVVRELVDENYKILLHQGIYFLPNSPKKVLQTIYERTLGCEIRDRIDGCIAKTEDAANYLRHFGFKNVQVLPVGFDPENLTSQSVRHNIRAKLGIGETDLVLLYVGLIEKRRRPDLLVNVIKELHERRVLAHLIVVGEGPLKDEIHRLAYQLKLDSYIHLVGKVPQEILPNYYSTSSLLVHPSEYEIFGMVFLEAMYFGLPVLASKTAGSESVIENNENGFLLSSWKACDWADCAYHFWKDPENISKLRSKAKQKSENQTWDSLAMQYVNFYSKFFSSL